jgi:hypothetical protein
MKNVLRTWEFEFCYMRQYVQFLYGYVLAFRWLRFFEALPSFDVLSLDMMSVVVMADGAWRMASTCESHFDTLYNLSPSDVVFDGRIMLISLLS